MIKLDFKKINLSADRKLFFLKRILQKYLCKMIPLKLGDCGNEKKGTESLENFNNYLEKRPRHQRWFWYWAGMTGRKEILTETWRQFCEDEFIFKHTALEVTAGQQTACNPEIKFGNPVLWVSNFGFCSM